MHSRTIFCAAERPRLSKKRLVLPDTIYWHAQHIAPTPRKRCASPGCIRPQPALDSATKRFFGAARKHFSGLEKTLRQNYALFDRHSQRVVEQQGMLLPRCAVIVEYADVLETVTAFATIADPPHDSFPS